MTSNVRKLPAGHKLGVGTIWMGRPWPKNNPKYSLPDKSEVESYLLAAYQAGIRHFDTAAAYGLAEERLGIFLREHPEILEDTNVQIATKWGEEWSSETGSTIDNSLANFSSSFSQSLRCLPKIDGFYFHKPTLEVLADNQIRREIEKFQDQGLIKYSGASVSDPDLLNQLWNSGLLWPDWLQTASWVVWQREDLVRAIADSGKRIIINSPVRRLPLGKPIKEAYQELASKPYISVVLTGTRYHLFETLGYFVGDS